MNTDPKYWREAGKSDHDNGNTIPAVTEEDFFREIENPCLALVCWHAYNEGFGS